MRSGADPEPPLLPDPLLQSASLVQQAAAVDSTQQHQGAADFLRQGSVAQKPEVTIPGGAVSITQSAENLFKAIAPTRTLFYRGGLVIDLIREEARCRSEVLTPVAAQSRFENFVQFLRPQKVGGRVSLSLTTISKAVAEQYLASPQCRMYLPRLNGILRCPILVERDGRLHRVEQGYDEVTGLFVETASPTIEVTLQEAVEFLSGLLRDFDFATPGDRSRAIASLLTPALKLGGLIKGLVPIDVAEATASQSGKTYRQKMVAALYNDRPAVVTKRSGGVGSLDETFAEHLVKGKVFIQFDNVRGKLESQNLESFMTAQGEFPARTPYKGSVTIDPGQFIIFISSNGFEAPVDLANRASIIQINKRDPNYSFHMHQGKDVLQMIFELQPVLMGAVFTIVEEWYRQGKPRTDDKRHDFREWCQSLDWIVQNIFHEAPLMDDHQEAKRRATSPQLTWLRTVAIKIAEQHKLNQAIAASRIVELCFDDDIDIPGLAKDNRDRDLGQKQVGRIMGKLFDQENEITIGNYRVVRRESSSLTESGNVQKLKNYTFRLNTPGSTAAEPPSDQAVPGSSAAPASGSSHPAANVPPFPDQPPSAAGDPVAHSPATPADEGPPPVPAGIDINNPPSPAQIPPLHFPPARPARPARPGARTTRRRARRSSSTSAANRGQHPE